MREKKIVRIVYFIGHCILSVGVSPDKWDIFSRPRALPFHQKNFHESFKMNGSCNIRNISAYRAGLTNKFHNLHYNFDAHIKFSL